MLRSEKNDLITKLFDQNNNLIGRIEQESRSQWKLSIVGIGFYSLEKTKKQAISEAEKYLSKSIA